MTPVSDNGIDFHFEELAAQIRKSSYFRVAWQLFEWEGLSKASPRAARQVIDTIVLVPEFQTFLASGEPPFTKPLAVRPLHAHSVLNPAGGTFERTLARAAADRLGAHSRIRADASPEQITEVEKLFQGLGPYVPFELLPGKVEGCLECRGHTSHLFSDWFYGVSWDWCYCVIWETRRLVGLFCMTDTD